MNPLPNTSKATLKAASLQWKLGMCGLLLACPACGIPKLRCAMPGPTLPDAYALPQPASGGTYGPSLTPVPLNNPAQSNNPQDANSLNLNSPSVQPLQNLNTVTPPPPTTSFRPQLEDNQTVQLASFVTPASPNELNQAPGSAVVTEAMTPPGLDQGDISANGLYEASDPQAGASYYDTPSQIAWANYFNDPALTQLVRQALSGNQELRILTEDVQIACYEVQARQGAYLPFVTLGAGAGVEKSSRYTREGAVEDQLEAAPGRSFPEPLPDFLVAANVSWEVDIWRRLRNAKDAAALRYFATYEGRRYAVTRLVAEVAERYYELLALDNRLATLDKTIAIQEQSLEMSKAMKEAARGTELAVQRFQAEVQKNQSQRFIIQQQIVEVENRINFLVGRYPQPVERPTVEYVNLNLRSLQQGVPAQLLQNRPDIQRAERRIRAAGLDVKSARARFYPSLTIDAGVGYRAFDTRYLFNTPEALIYNAAGNIVAPLVNKKAIQADYLTANSLQLQAIYDYQRTILNAFTEVINRLAMVQNYGQAIELKKQQIASLEASVDNATKLFQRAQSDYMEVLLAQRDMMEARMVLIETKQEQLSAVVNTYQALGGGTF